VQKYRNFDHYEQYVFRISEQFLSQHNLNPMTTIHAKYLGNLRTEAKHLRSGTVLMTDAPIDNKGKGESFSPTDLLATSLGCCMMTLAGIAAQEHGFSLEGTELDITKIMGTDPRRVREVIIEFTFPAILYSVKQKKIIEAAIRSCPVALSLNPELKQTLEFRYRDPD
jgi:putative redox protein